MLELCSNPIFAPPNFGMILSRFAWKTHCDFIGEIPTEQNNVWEELKFSPRIGKASWEKSN